MQRADPDGERTAWAVLALATNVPPRLAHDAVRFLGSARMVLASGPAALRRAGLQRRHIAAVDEACRNVAREQEALARLGGRVVAWSDAAYPALLRQIPDPPPALFLRGDGPGLEGPAVAIVGARRASRHGVEVAEELGRDLAGAGLVVVSGLANGIDAAAHRGALASGGQTIAVLGTGLDVVYPPWHDDLARRVSAAGALISEFPLGSPPLPRHFPRRNRIVSGLSVGTVVVEAAPQSGSLVTARLAADQNRQVFGVPGPVGRRTFAGSNGLIRDGATLVRGADDVLADLAPQLLPRLTSAREARVAADLPEEETQLLDALHHAPRQLEDLVKLTGMGVGRVMEGLLALELEGLVEQTAGKHFRRRAA